MQYRIAIVALCVACAAPEVSTTAQAVTYNGESRSEAYQSPEWRTVLDAVAFHVLTSDVRNATEQSGLTVSERYVNHGANKNLCTDQPFVSQPVGSGCSGTLIAPDLILSAGHCDPDFPCATSSWVFDFEYESAGRLAIMDANDVYRCQERVAIADQSNGLDYALYRLDRNVVGRTPVAWRANPSFARRDAVLLAGFPNGLPLKTDLGNVTALESITFKASVDAFQSNSGSGVFAPSRELIGVLARGNEDFVARGNCFVSNNIACGATCTDGEVIVRWSVILTDVCRRAPTVSICQPSTSFDAGAVGSADASVSPSDAGAPIDARPSRADSSVVPDTSLPPSVDDAATSPRDARAPPSVRDVGMRDDGTFAEPETSGGCSAAPAANRSEIVLLFGVLFVVLRLRRRS